MSTSASSSASSSAAPAERVGESAIARGGRRGTRRDLEAAVPRVESSAPKRRPRLGGGRPPLSRSFPSQKRGAAGAARPTAARAACIAPTTETHRSPRLSPGMTCACRRARGEWRAGDAPRGRGTKSDWIFAVRSRRVEFSPAIVWERSLKNKSHHHRALDRSRRPMDAFQKSRR